MGMSMNKSQSFPVAVRWTAWSPFTKPPAPGEAITVSMNHQGECRAWEFYLKCIAMLSDQNTICMIFLCNAFIVVISRVFGMQAWLILLNLVLFQNVQVWLYHYYWVFDDWLYNTWRLYVVVLFPTLTTIHCHFNVSKSLSWYNYKFCRVSFSNLPIYFSPSNSLRTRLYHHAPSLAGRGFHRALRLINCSLLCVSGSPV